MRDLTLEELEIMHKLGSCDNLHKNLPVAHPADIEEFVKAIHAAQNIILARPATETFQSKVNSKS